MVTIHDSFIILHQQRAARYAFFVRSMLQKTNLELGKLDAEETSNCTAHLSDSASFLMASADVSLVPSATKNLATNHISAKIKRKK